MKIFNVHFNKCGTTSLYVAMRWLGFKSYHYTIKEKVIRDWVLDNGFKGMPRFDFLGDFGGIDAEFAIPLIESAYSDAKFILTTRDKESRIESIMRHNNALSNDLFIEYSQEYDSRTFNFYEEYFRHKQNLLILPLEAENKWELLCNFLRKPIPNIPYPITNASAKV
jgi:hypothetical protein